MDMRLQFALAVGAALGFTVWAYGQGDPRADRDEVQTFASRIQRLSTRPIQDGAFPWPNASPADVDRVLATSGATLADAAASLSKHHEPLALTGPAMKSGKLGMALSMYGRRLAETNHPREAATAYKAALVTLASLLVSGTPLGVLAGSDYLVHVFAAIDELGPKLDADVLRTVHGFAWPRAGDALHAVRARHAADSLAWTDGSIGTLAEHARFESDMDIVEAAVKANAGPEACEPNVITLDARALCKKLRTLHAADEAIHRH
jgi:hypothetical protein